MSRPSKEDVAQAIADGLYGIGDCDLVQGPDETGRAFVERLGHYAAWAVLALLDNERRELPRVDLNRRPSSSQAGLQAYVPHARRPGPVAEPDSGS